MRLNLLIVILFCSFFSFQGLSQSSSDTLQSKLYAEAVAAIAQKKFEEAESSFKKIIKLKQTMPDELAYYYGYTLLNLGKYKTGKDLLKKYVSLRGDTGRFYHYALTYINFADCKETGSYFIEEVCSECEGYGSVKSSCSSCKGRGSIQCDVCGGMGVLRRRDGFGDSFTTCPKCNGAELLICPVCHGSLKETHTCYICDGTGKVRIKKDCDATIVQPGGN